MKETQKNYPDQSFHPSSTASEPKFWAALGVMMGTMASGAIVLFPSSVQAASLTQWHYDPTSNRLEVTLDQGTTPRYFLMAQPARIVLDLPDTAVGPVQSQVTYSGAIRQIRVSQFQPGLTRIVLELSPDVELAPGQVKLEKANHPTETDRWVLRPLIAQTASVQPPAKGAVSAPTVPQVSEPAPPTQAAVPLPPAEPLGTVKPVPFPVERPAPIQVPPLSSQPVPAPGASLQPIKPAPAQVVNVEKILPPPTPIPMGSDDGLKDPESSQVAQALPPASKTPLPPNLSPSELAIDTRNAIKISVPPPLSDIQTGTQTPAPAPVNVKPVAPAAATRPATSPPPAKAAPTAASSPVINPLSVEMPSTARMLPNPASPISVPTSVSPKSVSVPSVQVTPSLALPPQATTPLPPQAQLPPLTPLPSTPSPILPAFQAPVIKGGTSPAFSESTPVTSSIPGAEGLPASSSPNLPAGQAPSVTVPPLAPNSGYPAPLRQTPTAPLPSTPPTIAPLAPTATPLQPTPTFSGPGMAATPSPAKPSTVVAFGQPLPTTGALALNTFPRGVATYPAAPPQPALTGSVQQAFFQSPNPSVLLPLGATLNLAYPGNTALKLPSGPPLQEVLLLQTEVRDATGTVVFPQGTYVLGRFDTSGNGSKFIAQAIAVGERNIPFAAESNLLSNNRELSTTTMAIGSGIGALLGGAVSSFSGLGLLGGAAAGAATSFLTSPKQVTLQPGQVIQVQVKQDLLIR